MNSKRVLFCIDSTAYLRHIAPVIARFAESDYYDVEVIFLGAKEKLKENTLHLLSKQVSKLDILYASHRKLNLFFQELLTLFVFLHPLHSSPLLIKRSSLPSLLKFLVRLIRVFTIISPVVGRLLIAIIRNIYKLTLLTDGQFIFFRNHLKNNNYYFVHSAPYIFPNSRSVPFQLAARVTGTFLVGQIASWDNLTTKGTWVVKPDLFFVWNEAMKNQLSVLHPGLDKITSFHGSPTFESTKGYTSPYSRNQFLSKLSLSVDDIYILYLCSSPTIGGLNEDKVISELVLSLEEANILGRNVHLVVRTHPLLNLLNSQVYLNPPPNVHFYPKISTSPNSSADDNDLYLSSILHSHVVLGQNTSAFLDVCLLDRPCITLPEYPGLYNPNKFGHIQLLLDGNFIHQPSNILQLTNLVTDILINSGDSLQHNRSAFIDSFLYPSSSRPSASIFDKINNVI